MLERLSTAIQNDQAMLEILMQVRELDLNDCWIGAGFVRNKAWDLLHGFERPLKLNDIDVVFFDKEKVDDLDFENSIEKKLAIFKASVSWEVVNQAKTHLWHNRDPYKNTAEAISEWVETATCIAVRLNDKEELVFTAPHGTEDLENLILRPVPSLKRLDEFHRRIESKNWLEIWPKLKVVLD